jgi:NAD(P)-dependent dehydrogenase (short-subunit alcohol dehydrogenase family)
MSQPIAVVTGGGTGIGRAVAEELHRSGMRVRCLGMDVDVDAPDAVRAALADLDKVAVLVNAAGIIKHEGREFTPEGFRSVLDVNLCGTQILINALQERLIASAGAVVNVASMWSFFGSEKIRLTLPARRASLG